MQTRSNASKLPFQNLTPPYLESPSKKNAPKTTGTGKQIGKCIKAQRLHANSSSPYRSDRRTNQVIRAGSLAPGHAEAP